MPRIRHRDLPGTKPICYQLSYPGSARNCGNGKNSRTGSKMVKFLKVEILIFVKSLVLEGWVNGWKSNFKDC